jgi:transcriptional regulator with XRE-family HTH domain
VNGPEAHPHLGQRVRAERHRRGWSMHDLAERATLAVTTIHSVEHGKDDPRLSTLLLIAQAMRVSVDFLLAPPPPGGGERTVNLAGAGLPLGREDSPVVMAGAGAELLDALAAAADRQVITWFTGGPVRVLGAVVPIGRVVR